MDLKKAMGIAEILEDASPTSLAALASCASLKRVEKGAHLFQDKDDVDTIYTVISGMVSLYKYNSVGEKKVIFVFDKGKTIKRSMLDILLIVLDSKNLRNGHLRMLSYQRRRRYVLQFTGTE